MIEKNYSNPEDKCRFGFSMSGTYHAPYKSETAIIVLLMGVAAVIGVSMIFVLAGIFKQSKRSPNTPPYLVLIGCVVAFIIFAALMILIFGVGMKIVKKGFLCKYNANEACFTANIGGSLVVIHYSDVIDIDFTPRMVLGKIRGYDVDIKLSNSEEHLSICSDGYLSLKATPFYIIQERVELQRIAASEKERQRQSFVANISLEEVRQAQQRRQSAVNIVRELTGEAPEKTPAEEVEVSKPLRPAPPPPPAPIKKPVNVAGEVFGEERTFIENGRETLLHDLRSQGIFYLRPKLWTTFIVGMLSAAGGWCFGYFVVAELWYLFYFSSKATRTVFYSISGIIFAVLFAFHFTSRLRGKICSYRADALGFYVSIKGKGNEQVLFKDVLSVDYKPTKFLWVDHGYIVNIVTTYSVVSYDYIFPRFGHSIAKNDLPFEIIRQNAQITDDP